jgi:hypothetical protein
MDDMAREREAVCELIAEASAITERAERSGSRDERLAADAALLHAELTANLDCGIDAEVASDAAAAASLLDGALDRLDRLPPAVPALTG